MGNQIKERPILFSGAMVCALLAGTKTQTRREVKNQPAGKGIEIMHNGASFAAYDLADWLTDKYQGYGFQDEDELWRCPYGEPGQHLWVRETFGYNHAATEAKDVLVYRADHSGDQLVTWPRREQKRSYQQSGNKIEYTEDANHWYPSIFMPRTASRILLEVVSVRVERVQAISEADALAEGIVGLTKDGHTVKYGAGEPTAKWPWADWQLTAKDAYAHLWGSINGPESWAENPWVWVVEFKVIAPASPATTAIEKETTPASNS